MCESVQLPLSIQSVRLDLYTCYQITRVLLIFRYFQVFVFFSRAHSVYLGTANRETKARDLTSFQKDLRLDRHQSVIKLFVPMVVRNRVLSCLLLYSLFIHFSLYLNLQCRVHAAAASRICSNTFLPEWLETWVFCDPSAQFWGSVRYPPDNLHPKCHPALYCKCSYSKAIYKIIYTQ